MINELINLIEKYWLNHGDENVPKQHIDRLILKLENAQKAGEDVTLSADDLDTLYWIFRDEPAPDGVKEFFGEFYEDLRNWP